MAHKRSVTLRQFKPLGHRILILLDDPDRRARNGLVLPESHNPNHVQGVIVRTGTKDCGGLKQGDRVLISKLGGTDVKIGRKVYRLCQATDPFLTL